MNEELRRIDDIEIGKLEERFNQFQEAYIKNGKQLTRLGDLIEFHIADHEKFKAKMKPMIEFYDGISFIQKFLLYIIGGLTAVGILYLTIKKIFYGN